MMKRFDDLTRPLPLQGMRAIVGCTLLSLVIAPAAIGRAAGERAAVEGPAWTKTLPGDEVVELVGVSEHPARPDGWWRPDGSPLAEAPYARNNNNVPAGRGQQGREIAVRLSAPAREEESSITWKVDPSSGYGGGNPVDGSDRRVPGLHAITSLVPADATTCTVRFGVASGPWTTEAAHNGQGVASIGSAKGTTLFGRAREDGGKVIIDVADNIDGPDARVVAIDRAGKAHGPASAATVGSGGFRLWDLEFNVSPGEIREYQFQTRPYQWAEFPGVRLRPGKAEGAK